MVVANLCNLESRLFSLGYSTACKAHYVLAQVVFFVQLLNQSCMVQNTHRGARTHDHKVEGLALYRLS